MILKVLRHPNVASIAKRKEFDGKDAEMNKLAKSFQEKFMSTYQGNPKALKLAEVGPVPV